MYKEGREIEDIKKSIDPKYAGFGHSSKIGRLNDLTLLLRNGCRPGSGYAHD
jgi:hypothetical protein